MTSKQVILKSTIKSQVNRVPKWISI